MSGADSDHHPDLPPAPGTGSARAAEVTRRSLLQGSGALLAALAVGGCNDDESQRMTTPSPPTETETPAPQRPNILIVLADDMGFSDLGCFGSEIRTPNLDALARSGVRFTQFYNTARCCPSRASLLTGLYPHQAGVGHMVDNPKPFP